MTSKNQFYRTSAWGQTYKNLPPTRLCNCEDTFPCKMFSRMTAHLKHLLRSATIIITMNNYETYVNKWKILSTKIICGMLPSIQHSLDSNINIVLVLQIVWIPVYRRNQICIDMYPICYQFYAQNVNWILSSHLCQPILSWHCDIQLHLAIRYKVMISIYL